MLLHKQFHPIAHSTYYGHLMLCFTRCSIILPKFVTAIRKTSGRLRYNLVSTHWKWSKTLFEAAFLLWQPNDFTKHFPSISILLKSKRVCWICRSIKIRMWISKDLGPVVSFRLRLIFLTYIVSKLTYCLINLPLAFSMMLYRIPYVHNFCHYVATKNLKLLLLYCLSYVAVTCTL